MTQTRTTPTARAHVAFVLPTLEIGGMEKFVVLLGGALRTRGHDVSVVCTRDGGALVPEAEALGITVRVSPFVSRWDNLRPRALTATLRALGATVVHTQSGNWLGAALAGRAIGVPVVHTEHGMTSRPEPLALAVQKRLALARTDVTVVVSAQLQTELAAQLHVPASRFTYVPNGIPTAQHARNEALRQVTRAALGVTDETVVVGCVARLHPLKGVDVLAEAAARLDATSKVAIVVAGDGEERARIAAIAERSAVPFRLLGARADIPALLQAFDVLALPSRSEALPLALLEGMAAGCAIVATAVGEMPAIVRDDAGVVVPPQDVAALADALAAFARDGARRSACGEAARARARAAFDVDAMVERYVALYRKAGAAID
ncbi:MAG: glycosyltransferase [Gemmatimonadetes bacterium]|nr:glycosyltransferase [Gemmatimonadota bacterium]